MLLDIELPFKSWIGTSYNVNGNILINWVGRSEIQLKLQKKYSHWEMRNQIRKAKVCCKKMKGMVLCVCVCKIVQKVTGTKTDLSGLRFWSVCKCLGKVKQLSPFVWTCNFTKRAEICTQFKVWSKLERGKHFNLFEKIKLVVKLILFQRGRIRMKSCVILY